jgi:hypothetical protein
MFTNCSRPNVRDKLTEKLLIKEYNHRKNQELQNANFPSYSNKPTLCMCVSETEREFVYS